MLPDKSPLRFALLHEWLQWCDKSHPQCNQRDEKKLPTRLLYVGDPGNPDYNPNALKLVPGGHIVGKKYIALSYCWAEIDSKNDFRTTKENKDEREKEFFFSKLPRTLQDAIEVARRLGVQYLWIDALCIVQGEGGDWGLESKRMEDVYTSAYCTIAATSASGSYAGFLARNIEHVYIEDDSGRRVYIGTDIADFDKEVEEAPLNKRAWVVQERLLSCRTIHFGAHQMYWECGEGIYCEDLTQLKR